MKIGLIIPILYNRQKATNNYSFCAKQSLPPLTPQQQQLVETNTALVDFVMSPRFYQSKNNSPRMQNLKTIISAIMTNIDSKDDKYEDYKNAGIKGLINAARKYNSQKGAFSTYACYCIAQKIMRESQKHLLAAPKVSLNQEIKDKDTTLASIIKDNRSLSPEEQVAKKEEIKKLFDIVCRLNLSERYQRILEMRYIEEKTLRQIGEEFGITKERVHQILKDIIIKIKEAMQGKQKETKEERNQRIFKMYMEGVSVNRIAKNEDLAPDYIRNLLSINGIKLVEKREERDKTIIDLYNSRMTVKNIAREVDLDYRSIYKILKSNGIDIMKSKKERDQRIFEMSEEKIDPQEIAKTFKLKVSYVKQIIRTMKKTQKKDNPSDIIV